VITSKAGLLVAAVVGVADSVGIALGSAETWAVGLDETGEFCMAA
jgi:hypothetical protein